MKFYLHLKIVIFIIFVCISGCGGSGKELPENYIGTFKSYRSTNNIPVIIKINSDNGVDYKGSITEIPVEGKWGVQGGDALGLVVHQLDKGNDTNFLYFALSIAGTNISGAALRQ